MNNEKLSSNTVETQVVKEPGQRNWASALSRIQEPFRSAIGDFARRVATQTPEVNEKKDISSLESKMLSGGRALSLITYAAYAPYHLIAPNDVEAACDLLRQKGPKALFESLKEVMAKSQTILIIGDDPSPQGVSSAIEKCRESKDDGPIGTIIVGPGNLMEGMVRAWAAENNWPDVNLRSLDTSGGDVWHAQAGDAIDSAVNELFEVHSPTKIVLLEPVRLPATQSTIEQASRLKIPMVIVAAQRITAAPR